MITSDEYKALRDDLLHVLKSRDQFVLSTIVVTAAILGWAFTNNNTGNNDTCIPYLFLLPLAVIIPNTFFYAAQVRTGKKIGAYLHVFHESDECLGWERRQRLLKDTKPPEYLHIWYTSSFTALGLICILLFIMKGNYIQIPGFIFGIIFGLVLALLCWALITLWLSFNQYPQYLKAWKSVKNIEQELKEKNKLNGIPDGQQPPK